MMKYNRAYDVDRLLGLHAEGVPQRVIAETLGISVRTVQRTLQATGAKAAQAYHPPLSEVQHEEIRERLADGWSFMEISRTMGIAKRTLRRHYPGQGWTKAQVNAAARMGKREAALRRRLRAHR